MIRVVVMVRIMRPTPPFCTVLRMIMTVLWLTRMRRMIINVSSLKKEKTFYIKGIYIFVILVLILAIRPIGR